MGDLKPFFRIQTDAWLLALRDKVATTISQGGTTISWANSGQSATRQGLPVDQVSQQLTAVLIEKELVTGTATSRMTFSRF